MKNIGLIPNLEKDTDLSITKDIISSILSFDCTPFISEQIGEKLNMPEYSVNIEDVYRKSDFLIVLGGDGTLLSVGRKSAIYDTPLLGINLGTLGFLTDVEKGDVPDAISNVLKGDFKIQRRIMLEANILTKGTVSEGHIALNDVCITRGVFSKIVDLNVFVNGEYLDTFRADGIIICTPTGSTAYNLSAGGPIIKPDTEMVAITPICPHSFNGRSIVVSANDIITVEVDKHSRGSLLISMDGQSGNPLQSEDIIQIKRSPYCTSIIKTNACGFYDVLRRKLVRNGG